MLVNIIERIWVTNRIPNKLYEFGNIFNIFRLDHIIIKIDPKTNFVQLAHEVTQSYNYIKKSGSKNWLAPILTFQNS